MVLNVVLNGQAKGDFFVRRADDGGFLLRAADAGAMGLAESAGTAVTVEGEPFVPLGSIEGATAEFDESSLTLKIAVPPALLPKRTIDFLPQRRAKVEYPRDPGGFLNYRADYAAGGSLDFRSLDVTAELGARYGDALLLTDASYTRTDAQDRLVRLMSSVTHDRREELQRIVLGDFFAASGDLGSSLNIGGASFSKVYRIDPYFIGYPLADVTGAVPLPSDAEIFLDGMRIRTEKLAPGEFDLRNIPYYGGSGSVTVVIKDPFGREQRIDYPFYFTDSLLRKGLHEYSYGLGLARREFGAASNRYADPAFSLFHNYGVSDALTLGFRAEGAGGRVNGGAQGTFRVAHAGIASMSVSGSGDGSGRGGFAGQAGYTYQDKRKNARIFVKGFSRDYAFAAEGGGSDKVHVEAGAGAGYGTRRMGNLSVDLGVTGRYAGRDRKAATMTYSRNLWRSATLHLSLRRVEEETAANEFFAAVTYYPWRDISASARYRQASGADTETVQVQKNAPSGEGFGFRASVERADPATGGPVTTVNPFLQYNARYGIYTAEFRGESGNGGGETYRLAASGGVAAVGGAVGFSRPVADSFGLVRVDRLEGVRVYQNGQEVGRTDASGKVFVPGMGSYYENQVSIDDRDIPIDYSIAQVVKYISPPLRSGSVVRFETKKIRAITGSLDVLLDGEPRPLEFHEVRMTVDGRDMTFPTGKGGEFYLEDVGAGSYRAMAVHRGRTCGVDLAIPATDEVIVDLGRLVCEDIR